MIKIQRFLRNLCVETLHYRLSYLEHYLYILYGDALMLTFLHSRADQELQRFLSIQVRRTRLFFNIHNSNSCSKNSQVYQQGTNYLWS